MDPSSEFMSPTPLWYQVGGEKDNPLTYNLMPVGKATSWGIRKIAEDHSKTKIIISSSARIVSLKLI